MGESKKFQDLKDQERETRRNLILDQAERIFAIKSFEEVNMRYLAKKVGISPGSIYTYFPDKQSLYTEVALRGFHNALKIFTSAVEHGNTSLEKAAVDYIDEVIIHYEYFRMMNHCVIDGKIKSGEAMKKLTEIAADFYGTIESLIKIKKSSRESRMKAHLLFASLNGIVLNFLSANQASTREDAIAHMKELTGMLVKMIENE